MKTRTYEVVCVCSCGECVHVLVIHCGGVGIVVKKIIDATKINKSEKYSNVFSIQFYLENYFSSFRHFSKF